MTEPMDFLESIDWWSLFNILLSISTWLISWVGVFVASYYMIITIWAFLRFLKIKCGSRISPNGDLGILITGATSGFGLALSKLFYKLGFTIFATYYNEKEPGYKELYELGLRPMLSTGKENYKQPYIFMIKMDVRSMDSILDASKEVDVLLEKYGVKLYCLINNAGITSAIPIEWCTRDLITNVVSTNLTGAMLVTRQFILRIIQSQGRVINISSGTYPFPGELNNLYGSTKAAIIYFSRALHDGIRKYGASSHCLIPGNFITASNIIYPVVKNIQKSYNELSPEERQHYKKSIDKYRAYVLGLVGAKVNKSGDDLEQIAKIYDIDMALKEEFQKKPQKSGNSALLKYILNLMGGYLNTVEGKGALDAYEQAVCLKQPPLRLYPGNSFYAYFSGPSLEFSPSYLCELFGGSVIKSLSE